MHDMSRIEMYLHIAAYLMDHLEEYDEDRKKSFALYYTVFVHELDKDEDEIDIEYINVLYSNLNEQIRLLANYVLEQVDNKVSI